MARYDKRGVVIPAPLQGSDAALAGKRYGDKHRGPAVSDAYELWHCRIDLAERSERWPFPPDIPRRMLDLAQAVPEDQRTDWLRRQANLEEVDRRISYAIRSGDLPIWVAPQGEPERRVATGALATLDKRSVQTGTFCPLAEEYKSDEDRPWLWERPLFVKWDDWVRFAGSVDRAMTPETEAHHFRCGHTFTTDDRPTIAPWWSVNQALAWIATRIPSYVEYIGNLEADEPREHRPYIVHAICESQVAESDEGKAFMEARRASWPAGSSLAHAGRALLGKILAGDIRPMTRESGQGRQMRAEEFAGIGGRETGSDWLDLTPQPLFSSNEVMQAFAIEEGPSEVEAAAETPAELPAWLKPYQLVAWVQYRNLQVVAKAGNWHGLAAQHMYGDEPKIGSRTDLEAALQLGRLVAQGYPKNGDSFAPIPAVEWSRIALAPLDPSRQHPYARIQFSRQDVLSLFPSIGSEGTERSQRAPVPFRKKPGPDPDPDWPGAISKVTADCIAAGYSRPLKRGDKAAIQNLLLSAMAEKNKHPSEDTARKYAEKVIAELPEKSG